MIWHLSHATRILDDMTISNPQKCMHTCNNFVSHTCNNFVSQIYHEADMSNCSYSKLNLSILLWQLQFRMVLDAY